MDPVFEILQIRKHGKPCNWRRNQKSDYKQPDKLLSKNPQDIRNAGAQHFANADFFGPANGHKRNQPIQTQTPNKNGNAGKSLYELQHDIIELIKTGNGLIQKLKTVDVFRIGFIPDFFKGSKRGFCMQEATLYGTLLILGVGGK